MPTVTRPRAVAFKSSPVRPEWRARRDLRRGRRSWIADGTGSGGVQQVCPRQREGGRRAARVGVGFNNLSQHRPGHGGRITGRNRPAGGAEFLITCTVTDQKPRYASNPPLTTTAPPHALACSPAGPIAVRRGRNADAAVSCGRSCRITSFTSTKRPRGPKRWPPRPQSPPDLVLLDLGLPDMDGQEVIERLREWLAAPIIVVSVRDQDKQKIMALNHGADDYLTKPFSTGELLARIQAALRRASARSGQCGAAIFECDELTVDLTARRVTVRGGRGATDAARIQAAGDDGALRGQSADAPISTGRSVGPQALRKTRSICACSWPGCGARSRASRRGRAIC